MSNYDLMVSDCKRAATAGLCRLVRECPDKDLGEMASLLDQLNEALDKLADALVRQREERDEVIRDLINQLAEAKKRR